MQLLYCDESNLEHRPGDFLLYAGVMIPESNAKALSEDIVQRRAAAGIDPAALVKFNPIVEPLDHDGYRDFKAGLIQSAIDHGARLIGYAVLHDLAGNADTARRYGVNTLCWNFHCILTRTEETGLVMIDRFNDANNQIDGHLRDKMAVGVELPHRGLVPLGQIVGFHYSAIGQSHFTSLSDILVGSLRWAINVHCRNLPQRRGALALLRHLSPMFWREVGSDRVTDMGFSFSPFGIRAPRYYERYTALQEFLREGGIASSQEIQFVGG